MEMIQRSTTTAAVDEIENTKRQNGEAVSGASGNNKVLKIDAS